MKILVTGGAGYIGSVVAETLINTGYEVIVVDNFFGDEKSPINPKIKLIKGDIGDLEILRRIFEENDIDAVMHLAAFIEVEESMRLPQKYFENNYEKPLRLLEAMRKARTKLLIFSSTAAVYGIPNSSPIKETDLTNPINPYGESKLKFEKALFDEQQKYGLKYVALRYFNAAGATPEHGVMGSHQTHLISVAMQVATGERDSIKLYGNDYPTKDGTCIRDYVHVQDIASAHLVVLNFLKTQTSPEANKFTDNVYNVGSGQGYSNKEVLDEIQKISGKKLNIVLAERRLGDPPALLADISKISELGWEAEHSGLINIIKTAWGWKKG
ncbi:MAG: UDP-glucose 4-epimerase [Candidatus Doudnabacteria bacterium]|nr:UDP-glucose 4-epimerase [Candidatus Doudnabacteria bacterium]